MAPFTGCYRKEGAVWSPKNRASKEEVEDIYFAVGKTKFEQKAGFEPRYCTTGCDVLQCGYFSV